MKIDRTEAKVVQWAINENGDTHQNHGRRWTIWSPYQDDILITPNFAKRINEADMGRYLRGYTLKGELITVKIGARYY